MLNVAVLVFPLYQHSFNVLYVGFLISCKLKSKCFPFFFIMTARIILEDKQEFLIGPSDIVTSLPCNSMCVTSPRWNFVADEYMRVHIEFQELECWKDECYIEIGDGLIFGTDTKLARFAGRALPCNVTSISNTAWIIVHTSCRGEVLQLQLRVAPVNKSGAYKNMYFIVHNSIITLSHNNVFQPIRLLTYEYSDFMP